MDCGGCGNCPECRMPDEYDDMTRHATPPEPRKFVFVHKPSCDGNCNKGRGFPCIQPDLAPQQTKGYPDWLPAQIDETLKTMRTLPDWAKKMMYQHEPKHEFEVKELINAILILDYRHQTQGTIEELQGMAKRAAGIIGHTPPAPQRDEDADDIEAAREALAEPGRIHYTPQPDEGADCMNVHEPGCDCPGCKPDEVEKALSFKVWIKVNPARSKYRWVASHVEAVQLYGDYRAKMERERGSYAAERAWERKRLGEWVMHKQSCDWWLRDPCTCGLDAARGEKK